MRTDYTFLDKYCDVANITYQEFGTIVGIQWRTIYGIIKGLNPPSKKNARILDKWIEKNYENVFNTISKSISGDVKKLTLI